MKNISKEPKKTEEMERYENETGKYAIWRGLVTEGFNKWQRGDKIYDRDKERISLYIAEDSKEKWQKFIKNTKYTSISKLIRDAVDFFIKQKTSGSDLGSLQNKFPKSFSNISHEVKEALTSIKGFSQLLIENYDGELEEEVMSKVKEIFTKSVFIENKIKEVMEERKPGKVEYDILLIEDDLSTIKLLTTFFENKGYRCKGVISGSKAMEELKRNRPKIILLDIILPDINGYDIGKMLRADKELKDILVYFLTAIPGSEVEKKMKESGAKGFILKPFDFQDFEVLYSHL